MSSEIILTVVLIVSGVALLIAFREPILVVAIAVAAAVAWAVVTGCLLGAECLGNLYRWMARKGKAVK